jgi:hypothetical protein
MPGKNVKTSRCILPLLISTVAWGCVSSRVEPAVAPSILREADLPTRQAQYEKYKLVFVMSEGKGNWARQDGAYTWAALENLAREYPEAQDVYDRASTRATTIVAMSSTGGAIGGFTLGWNTQGSDDNHWSTGTQVALYSVSGALLVASLVALFAWHNPAADFADTYNSALRRDLRLPETQAELRPPRLAPRALESGEIGWSF